MLLYLAWITIGWQETIKAEGVKIFARNMLGSGGFVGLGLSSVQQIIHYSKETKLKLRKTFDRLHAGNLAVFGDFKD